MIGEIVGTYRVIAEVGSGGMGAVWLGEHTLLGSRAAIKVLKPEYSQQKAIVDRFFDEARAATRIVDPGIVTVFDFGWHHDRSAYLVMELLSGETLARRIKRVGVLAPANALSLLRMCAATMAAAHERGIVHRDLKPDNIFVVPDLATGERVKILDFGIAKLLGEGAASHEKTQTGLIMGTPGYMSPEQCRGARTVDHRTDVYALGCVLFHALCGRPPFVAGTAADLIAYHLTQAPPVPSNLVTGIGERLDALVLDCLAKSADERIPSMTDLVARIDEVVTSGSIQTAFVAPRLRASAPVLEETPPATLRPSAESVAVQARERNSATPIRASFEHVPVPETVAATTTTTSSLSGELDAARPRRTGAILLVFGLVAAAAIVVIVLASRKTGDREPRTAQTPDPPPATASGSAPEPEIAIEPVHEARAPREAVPIAATVDEAPKPPPTVRRPPPERPPVVTRPPERGSAKPPVTPGSAKPPVTLGSGTARPPPPAGSGSAATYADR